ncbi:hypothetical protein [Symbioplanes lichenis]|uniref:hypothetical protein n=1 Tax=Symbioplanes lichenis TaxID=1629072 RepID=UPI002738939B|nr:hypothetical protein [Actinoplanes lichenis]
MKPELSDMLRDAKSDAPSPRYSVDDFVAAGRKQQRKVRTMWVGTGAAAAVLAVAGAVAVPQLLPGGETTTPATQVAAPAAKPSAKPFTYPDGDFTANFAPYRVGDLSVSKAILVTPGYEVASITAPGRGQVFEDENGKQRDVGNQVAALTVFKPGAFDPSVVKKGEKTGDAYFTEGVGGDPKKGKPGNDGTYAWEYADDAWAVIKFHGGEELQAKELAAVAKGLKVGATAPVKIGFKLGYVPDGYELAAAGTTYNEMAIPLEGSSYALLLKGDLPFTGLKDNILDPYVVGDKQLPLLQLQVFPKWYAKYPAKDDKSWCESESLCYIAAPGGDYVLELSGGGMISDDELLKVLDNVTFAAANNQKTWFDATGATK